MRVFYMYYYLWVMGLQCSVQAIVDAATVVLQSHKSYRVLIYCNPPFTEMIAFRKACFDALCALNVPFAGRVSLAFLVPHGSRISTGARETISKWRQLFPHVTFDSLEFTV